MKLGILCFLEELNVNQEVYQDVKNINRQYGRMIRIQNLNDILHNQKRGLVMVKITCSD